MLNEPRNDIGKGTVLLPNQIVHSGHFGAVWSGGIKRVSFASRWIVARKPSAVAGGDYVTYALENQRLGITHEQRHAAQHFH